MHGPEMWSPSPRHARCWEAVQGPGGCCWHRLAAGTAPAPGVKPHTITQRVPSIRPASARWEGLAARLQLVLGSLLVSCCPPFCPFCPPSPAPPLMPCFRSFGNKEEGRRGSPGCDPMAFGVSLHGVSGSHPSPLTPPKSAPRGHFPALRARLHSSLPRLPLLYLHVYFMISIFNASAL